MINAIGEATLQQFIRTNINSGIAEKDIAMQKTDKIKEQRPVEESDDGQKPEMNLQSQKEITTRNSLEDGELIIEKYTRDGKLVRKIPPGYLPFGEAV